MKIKTLTLVVIFLAAGTILNGCNTPAEKVDNAQEKVVDAQKDVADAKEDLEQVRKDSITEFQRFKNESNATIADNERRIANLKVDMKNEKAEARAKDERKVDALERRNRELKKKLDDYKDDGKSDWQEFKKEFNHDLEGLGHAFKDITVRNTK